MPARSLFLRAACVLVAYLAAFMARAEAPARVALVTCFPGEQVYELDGHTALRVTVPDGPDVAVSYGLFDFSSPNFLYRFVKGETDYMVGAMPWQPFLASYAAAGRTVVEHELDLDSAQTARLLELLSVNLLPQNRVYRYNYVKDNCATRPLRIVELAVGDSILLPPPARVPADLTFRKAMETYHADYPWYQLGIDLALGCGIDYPISPREAAFSPMLLDGQLSGAHTPDGRPIVKSTSVLLECPSATLGPTPWPLRPGPVLWFVSLLIAVACFLMARRGCVWRWLYCVFYSILALAGCLLAFLVLISTHEATSPNFLLLFFNPFCALPAIFIWLKKCNSVVFWYEIANFAVIIAGCVSWPLTGQAFNAALAPVLVADALLALTYIYTYCAARVHS